MLSEGSEGQPSYYKVLREELGGVGGALKELTEALRSIGEDVGAFWALETRIGI